MLSSRRAKQFRKLFDALPADVQRQSRSAPHPDEVLAAAPAGTVLVFSAHLWHGGTQNTIQHNCRALHCFYCTGKDKQHMMCASTCAWKPSDVSPPPPGIFSM